MKKKAKKKASKKIKATRAGQLETKFDPEYLLIQNEAQTRLIDYLYIQIKSIALRKMEAEIERDQWRKKAERVERAVRWEPESK